MKTTNLLKRILIAIVLVFGAGGFVAASTDPLVLLEHPTGSALNLELPAVNDLAGPAIGFSSYSDSTQPSANGVEEGGHIDPWGRTGGERYKR